MVSVSYDLERLIDPVGNLDRSAFVKKKIVSLSDEGSETCNLESPIVDFVAKFPIPELSCISFRFFRIMFAGVDL